MKFDHGNWGLRFVFVVGMTALGVFFPVEFACGQDVSENPSTGRTIPFSEWIDAVWADHLQVRVAGIADDAPVIAEAFYRDALRVDPGSIVLLERLALFYRDSGLSPMDAMIASYGRLLDNTRPAWTNIPTVAPTDQADVSEDIAVYAEAKRLFDENKFLRPRSCCVTGWPPRRATCKR